MKDEPSDFFIFMKKLGALVIFTPYVWGCSNIVFSKPNTQIKWLRQESRD